MSDETAGDYGITAGDPGNLSLTDCTAEPTQGNLGTMSHLRPVRQEHRTENGQHRIRLWMGEQEPRWAYQIDLPEPLGPVMGGEVVVFEVIWPARGVPSPAMVLPHGATFTHLDMAPGSGLTASSPMTSPLPDAIAGAEFWAGIEGGWGDDDEPG